MRSRSRKQKYILSPEPLGAGGQAQIFKARVRQTNEIVALKQVTSSDEETFARMRREIEVQSTVKHLNVMPILDYSSNFRWYTMPLADKVLGRLSPPVDESLLARIIEHVALGLAVAHENRYIHRDITPNNILHVSDSNGSRWVVADWGLVRSYGKTTIARTLPGQPFGTMGFAAPEMWEDAHAVDERADVYSLGRVVAWCLTGKWPSPNVPLLPGGKWHDFIAAMTEHDLSYRIQNMQVVLNLLEYTFQSSQDTTYYSLSEDFTTSQNSIASEPIFTQDSTNFSDHISPVEAKAIISKRSKVVLRLLKDKDMEGLAEVVHPIKGTRFTPYSYTMDSDIVLHHEQIRSALTDENIYDWGAYDGTGFPIRLSIEDYFDRFVYNQDFLEADVTTYNEEVYTGNTANNAADYYPDSIIVGYKTIGTDPKYEGMDWAGLRLIFEELNNTWYLVGIVHDEWTI